MLKNSTSGRKPGNRFRFIALAKGMGLSFFQKPHGMLFVAPGCHASLSSLVVTPPCHFDRRAGNRENLMCDPARQHGAGCPAYGSRVDRGARGAQSQSLKVSQSLGRPDPFPLVSRDPVNRRRSLTIEPRPTPFGRGCPGPSDVGAAGRFRVRLPVLRTGAG